MILDWQNNRTWNPLTDDEDVLRLAINLKLIVCDLNEATRRAIIRSYVELGKETK